MTITVVTLDDHYLIREGVRRMLDAHRDIELVGEGTTGAELYPLVAQYQPDIVLLDLGLPHTAQGAHTERTFEFSAFPVVARLRTEYSNRQII